MRGYDHALLIAKDIADKKGLDLLAVVSRFTQTRQVGSDKKHRMEQLQNAFYIKSPVTVRGRKVLIVDDITTSGATLDCMATVLHKAGASQINAVVFAQKQ